VIDRQTYLRLQDIIRREGRSFLQYAGESFPWATLPEQEAVAKLQQLVVEERESAAALARYLAKNRLTPPYLGAYPSYFTSYNFLALPRLLVLLVGHQKRGLEELQRDVTTFNGETRHQVEHLLEMKKRHLQELEKLAAGPVASTSIKVDGSVPTPVPYPLKHP
jgi:hypothetical protein